MTFDGIPAALYEIHMSASSLAIIVELNELSCVRGLKGWKILAFSRKQIHQSRIFAALPESFFFFLQWCRAIKRIFCVGHENLLYLATSRIEFHSRDVRRTSHADNTNHQSVLGYVLHKSANEARAFFILSQNCRYSATVSISHVDTLIVVCSWISVMQK